MKVEIFKIIDLFESKRESVQRFASKILFPLLDRSTSVTIPVSDVVEYLLLDDTRGVVLKLGIVPRLIDLLESKVLSTKGFALQATGQLLGYGKHHSSMTRHPHLLINLRPQPTP